ncbi:hypothetical protein [Azonexus sp.]|nr:hypothetical protein [Azonexus sp.]
MMHAPLLTNTSLAAPPASLPCSSTVSSAVGLPPRLAFASEHA